MKEIDQINVATLTGGECAGSGLYEELMRATQSHLEHEFKSQRITGVEYAIAYTQSLASTLQASVQYMLQYPLTNIQVELGKRQIEAADKQNELLDLQREQLQLANDAQRFTNECLLPEQCKQAKIQTQLMMEQVIQAEIQTDILSSQLVAAKLQEELVQEQIKNQRDQNTDPTGGLNKIQFDKIKAEMQVMAQKLKTEMAQTQDKIDGVCVGGLVGKEIALKNIQREGFVRNAEVNVAKIFSDVFNMAYATSPDGHTPDEYGFSKANTTEVVNKLLISLNKPVPDGGCE